jgi:hypothetical protein
MKTVIMSSKTNTLYLIILDSPSFAVLKPPQAGLVDFKTDKRE